MISFFFFWRVGGYLCSLWGVGGYVSPLGGLGGCFCSLWGVGSYVCSLWGVGGYFCSLWGVGGYFSPGGARWQLPWEQGSSTCILEEKKHLIMNLKRVHL